MHATTPTEALGSDEAGHRGRRRVMRCAILAALICASGLSAPAARAQPGPVSAAGSTELTCGLSGLVRLKGRTAYAGTQIYLDGELAATTAGSGFFEIDGLAPGSYALSARHAGFLSAENAVVPCLTERGTRMPDLDLPGGDINRDQSIDLFDLVRVGGSYGTCVDDAGFDREADLNQSGCIDLFDLVLVGTGYGQRGPTDWPLPSGRFATEILPIMQRYCTSCHGSVAGLRLDSYAALMAGGRSGPPVVPGEPESSLLYNRLLGEGGPIMPPGGIRVSSDEIAVVRAWIEAGAPEN